jgi:hypothetical protein
MIPIKDIKEWYMNKSVPFTLRFDRAIYHRVKETSRREGRSITSFVKEAVDRKLEEEVAAALYDAFTMVGGDTDEARIDFAYNA